MIFKNFKDDITGLNKNFNWDGYTSFGKNVQARWKTGSDAYVEQRKKGYGRIDSFISGVGAFSKQPKASITNVSDEIKANVQAVKDQSATYTDAQSQIGAYTAALGSLDAAHRALTLSTVGLNNSQIEQQLLSEGLEAEAVNLAMANAGLLSSETALTSEKWKEITQSQLLTAEQQTELATKLGLTEAEITAGTVSQQLTAERFNQAAAEMQLNEAQKVRLATLLGLDVTQRKVALSAKIASAAMGVLRSAMSMGAMMAIAWGIGKIGEAISNKRHEAEEAAKAAAELTKKFKEQRLESAKNRDELEELVSNYEKLSQGVDLQGKNISLTNEEYNSYLKTVSSISDIIPSLNVIFDEHGQKIGFVTGQLKDANAEYDKYLQKEAIKSWETDEDKDGNADIGQIMSNYNNSHDAKKWKKIDPSNPRGGMTPSQIKELMSPMLSLQPGQEFNKYIDEVRAKIFDANDTYDQKQYKQDYLFNYLKSNGVVDIDFENSSTGLFDKEKVQELLDYAKEEEQKIASQLQEAMQVALQKSDDYYNLSSDERAISQNVINKFDYDGLTDIFGKYVDEKRVEDYAKKLTSNLKGNKKVQDAWNNLIKLNSDENLNLSVSEYENKVNEYLTAIAETIGFTEDQIKNTDLLWDLRVSFGISDKNDTHDLKGELEKFIKDNLGLFGKGANVDKILDTLWSSDYTEKEIKLLITGDIKTIDLSKYQTDKGFDFKGLQEGIRAIAGNEAVITSLTEKSSDLSSSLSTMSKKWKYFNWVSGATNGTLYLTNAQMSELVQMFPDIEKKLKYTKKGWQLESSAMDLVSNAVMDLQTSYAMAQKVMTSEETKAAMQRLNITQAELNNIQTVAQAYAYLAQKFGSGLTLSINADGSLDTSKLTQEQLATWNIVNTAAMSNRAIKALKDSQKLGSDENEKKEKEAKTSYDKKVRDINEKQADADFKHKIDLLTQALDNQAEAIEGLSTTYDNFYENDYSSKIEYTTKLYKEQSEYAIQLKKDMDSLIAEVPTTSASWTELASSLEDVSSKYFENQRKLLEYRNQLYENKVDAYKNIGAISDSLTGEENDPTRIKNWVEKGSAIGGLFDYNPITANIIPKDKIEKEKKENLELEKEQKRYQDKINEIKARAIDEAKKYDDEQRRMELDEALEEYNDAISAVSDSMTSAMLDTNAAWLDDGKDKFNELSEYFKQQGIVVPITFTTENGKVFAGGYTDSSGTKIKNSLNPNADALDISQAKTAKVWKDGKSVKEGYNFSKGVVGLKVYPDGSMTWRDPSDPNGGIFRTAKINTTGISDSTGKKLTDEQKSEINAANKFYEEFLKWNNGQKSAVVKTKANGGLTSGLTIEGEAGREGYIGKDRKLHWFNDRAEMFDAEEPVNIINADDMQKIVKYTGDRYFNEPIGNLGTVTALANGNTNVSFSPSPSATPNAAVNDIYKQVNSSFDKLKNSVSILPLQNAVYSKFTDKSFYAKLSKGVTNQSVAATNDVINRLYRLIAKNSTWTELSDEVKAKFTELGANEANWSDWIKNNSNQIAAVDILQTNEMSWDTLDTSVQDALSAVGINSSETWNNFVYEHPMEALELLETSWDTMNNQVSGYLDGAIDIAAYGADAISDIEIDSPDISQQSWDGLQTLIANKIQEIINQINKTFGDNTVDLNFGVTLKGNEHTNPQGDGSNAGIIGTAEQYLGTPYVWGGTTPSGFDCSGLVQYVFAQNGKHISRTTYTQIKEGVPVDRNNLQPGDAVFFGNSNRPHHVGIYAGNGQFIHAPHTGDVVKYSDLNSAYYSREFCGARRYANGTSNAEPGLANVGDEYLFTGVKHPTPELIFNKHSNKTYLAGCNGVEHVKLHSGDVVVPYAQTKKMLEEGFIPGNQAFPTGTGNIGDYSNLGNLDIVLGLPKLTQKQIECIISKFFSKNGSVVKLSDAPGIYQAQQGSGVSAMAILGIGGLESAYGTSNIARAKHNLWGYGAVDNNPMGGAFTFDSSVGNGAQSFAAQFLKTFYNGYKHHSIHEIGNVRPKYATDPQWSNKVTRTMEMFQNALIEAGVTPVDALSGSAGTRVVSNFISDFAQKLQALYGKLLSDGVLGTFHTNTHTSNSKVANIDSLSDSRQRNYSFNTPFMHANGTKDYHVVGENYKPEIMLDKSNGSMFVVDSPMVFDPAQYDVIGEQSTKELNKSLHFHEKGTLTHSQQGYLDTINAVLSDEDKYTADTMPWEAEKLSDISKWVKNIDENTKDLDGNSYLDESKHISRDNLENYVSWYESFEAAKDSATSEEIEAALAESARLYDKNQDNLARDMESQFGEVNDALLTQVKQGASLDELYATTSKASAISNDYYRKSTINTIKFDRERIELLKQSKTELEKLRDIAPTATEYAKANEAIKDLTNSMASLDNEISELYEQERERTIDEFEQIDRNVKGQYQKGTSYVEKENEELSRQLDKTDNPIEKSKLRRQIMDNRRQQESRYSEGITSVNDKLAEVRSRDEYKELQAKYGYDFNAILDANGEFNDYYYDFLKSIDDDAEKKEFLNISAYLQQHNRQLQEYIDGQKEAQDSYDDFYSQQQLEKIEKATELRQRENEVLQFQSNMQKAVTSGKESLYNLVDTLRDERNAIKEQLQANKQIDQWLTEDTRALLFNEDDYAKEMAVINDIEAEAREKYEEYHDRIMSLGEEDSWQEAQITAEYNKQVEALQDKLTLAKDQLDVAKKTAAFNNAVKERDTQIIMGNRVQNVADPEKLYQLAQEKAKSENTLNSDTEKSIEKEDIRNMERVSDSIDNLVAQISAWCDMVGKMSDREKERFADFLPDIEEITYALETLHYANPFYLMDTDNAMQVYSKLVKDDRTSHGYDMTFDYEEGLENLEEKYSGKFVKGSLYRSLLSALMLDHDYKTSTDNHNDLYGLHKPNHSQLDGTYVLPMSESERDNSAWVHEGDRRLSEIEDVQKAVDESISDLKELPTISGKGSVVYEKLFGPDSFENYIPIELSSVLPQVSGDGSILMSSINRLPDMFRAPNIDNLATPLNEDNSVTYQVGNVTITTPVDNVDDIFRELTRATAAKYNVSKNIKR